MPNRSRKLAAVPAKPRLDLGSHDLNLECPKCSAVLSTVIELAAVLSVTTEDNGRLKARLINNKALEHICGGGADGKGTPAMFDDNGDAAAAVDPFGDDPFKGDEQ